MGAGIEGRAEDKFYFLVINGWRDSLGGGVKKKKTFFFSF
jgi:hypothetical protein